MNALIWDGVPARNCPRLLNVENRLPSSLEIRLILNIVHQSPDLKGVLAPRQEKTESSSVIRFWM